MRFSFITVISTILAVAYTAPVATTGDGEFITTIDTPTKSIERRESTGRGTYYFQQGSTGSCGYVSSDSAMIVALSVAWRNTGQLNCGRTIWAEALTGPGTGNRILATVQDTCPGCTTGDVDFSVGAFQGLTNGNLDVGAIKVRWDFV